MFTAEEGISILRKVIYHLESYDIITVRASVGESLCSLGVFLLLSLDNILADIEFMN